MLDGKYKELGGSGLVTTPLNIVPNLSECNVSHAGIAQTINSKYMLNHLTKFQDVLSTITFSTIF